MGHQIYALLCRKITSFPPSEAEVSEKLGTYFLKKWKFFKILPVTYWKKNCDNFFWLSWCIKDSWGTKLMCWFVVKWPVFRLQRGSAKSALAPSVLDLYASAKNFFVHERAMQKPAPKLQIHISTNVLTN